MSTTVPYWSNIQTLMEAFRSSACAIAVSPQPCHEPLPNPSGGQREYTKPVDVLGEGVYHALTHYRFPLGEQQRVIEWVRCPDREHSKQCHKSKSRKGCNCST